MIAYEDFKKHVTMLKRQIDFENKLEDLLKEYRDVVGDAEAPLTQSYWNLCELLESACGLKKDYAGYTTLSWWMEETDFGRNVKEPPHYYDNDENEVRTPDIDLSTIRGIYDLIQWEVETFSKKEEEAEK